MGIMHKEKEELIRMSRQVFQGIKAYIGDYPAERGGMLGRDSDGVIRHFEPDQNGRCSRAAYDPDITYLNGVIKKWKENGIQFCGFVHSHPSGFCRLSGADESYAGDILEAFKKLDFLFLPVVQAIPDTGQFYMLPFIAVPGRMDRKACRIVAVNMYIEGEGLYDSGYSKARSVPRKGRQPLVDAPAPSADKQEAPASGVKYIGNFDYLGQQFFTYGKASPRILAGTAAASLRAQISSIALRNKYTERIKGMDALRLDSTRLVVIGAGGAASLIRNCARMGFGEFVLIDPDVITYANISTQHADPGGVGRAKVEMIGHDIASLNPAAAVLAIQKKVETLDDRDFLSIFQQPLRAGLSGDGIGVSPTHTILLVLTDNFWAQARGHRLGLNFGLPTICAQEYIEGRGAEVTYTVPGVTPACHRCITASRYRAYLEESFTNDVTSEDAPIFAAELLNGVLGHVVLMIAHHGTDHHRWGNLIERMGSRNLIQLRMDPDFDVLFGDKFSKRLKGAIDESSFFMLDSIFLAQTPDCGQSADRPICPDCGGTGDLRDAIYQFQDTRRMMPMKTAADLVDAPVSFAAAQAASAYGKTWGGT